LAERPAIFCYSQEKSAAPWLRSFELLSHLNTSAVVLLAGAFLLGIFFAYVYQQKRQAYLMVWASAWLLVSLYFVRSAFSGPAPLAGWVGVISEWVMALAALGFYCSRSNHAADALCSPHRFRGRRGRGVVFRLSA
jgi:hypothetical protein